MRGAVMEARQSGFKKTGVLSRGLKAGYARARFQAKVSLAGFRGDYSRGRTAPVNPL